MPKTALITGVTGQDGSYLVELLLGKGYEVHGLRRRASTPNISRIQHILSNPKNKFAFTLHYGDVTDASNLIRIIQEVKPDEIYNLAAQSHVRVSFDSPEYTAQVSALGVLRVLEAVRILNMSDKVKIYQASTSELFGKSDESPQNETTPFKPVSPYGIAKLYAYWSARSYRTSYGIFCCNGILFNHESPRRDPSFVTRKITSSVSKIMSGKQDKLFLGNMDAKRDWGFAPDYVEAMWRMLQQEEPDDYVIATCETHSVREFVTESFSVAGIHVKWEGVGLSEIGIDSNTGKTIVAVDPWYFRPNEIDSLIGDYSKASKDLGWNPTMKFTGLVKTMTQADLVRYSTNNSNEYEN